MDQLSLYNLTLHLSSPWFTSNVDLIAEQDIGYLTQITVVVKDKDTEGMTVQELKYPIIIKHFDNDPKVFQLVVTFAIVE